MVKKKISLKIQIKNLNQQLIKEREATVDAQNKLRDLKKLVFENDWYNRDFEDLEKEIQRLAYQSQYKRIESEVSDQVITRENRWLRDLVEKLVIPADKLKEEVALGEDCQVDIGPFNRRHR